MGGSAGPAPVCVPQELAGPHGRGVQLCGARQSAAVSAVLCLDGGRLVHPSGGAVPGEQSAASVNACWQPLADMSNRLWKFALENGSNPSMT